MDISVSLKLSVRDLDTLRSILTEYADDRKELQKGASIMQKDRMMREEAQARRLIENLSK